ncbi:MAG: DedA family protein [Deltaproteobacteria bacterium]|nr:DedA family protein [Deltaproteobacteria bacterium]
MKLIIELLNHLTPYGHLGYFIMFAILLACGFGFPMPEDVILISGGILASRGVTDFFMTFVVCMLGVLIGDGIVFSIGRKMGPKIRETRIFRKIMHTNREAQVSRWFTRYGDKVIFFARFAPGLRMPLFMTAGMYQVSFWKFFFLDGFAALISVPVWIWIGYVFGANLELLEEKMKQFQIGIYSVLAAVLVLILAFWYVKKKFKPSI